MELKTKIILGVIMATIIGLILYFVLSYEEAYFNKINTPENTFIRNKTNYTYMDTIVAVGIAELDLYPKVVSIVKMDDTNTPKDEQGRKTEAHIIGENGQYIIYVSDMNRSKAVRILSHELIHLDQMESGRIATDKENETLTWNGKVYTKSTIPPYDQREWEIEAEDRGWILQRLIKNILYE